jgi:hypothetical protein
MHPASAELPTAGRVKPDLAPGVPDGLPLPPHRLARDPVQVQAPAWAGEAQWCPIRVPHQHLRSVTWISADVQEIASWHISHLLTKEGRCSGWDTYQGECPCEAWTSKPTPHQPQGSPIYAHCFAVL